VRYTLIRYMPVICTFMRCTHETHAYEMNAYEVHAPEVYPYEMHAHEMHAREVHAHETLTNGGTVVDLSRSDLQKKSFRASCRVVPMARRKGGWLGRLIPIWA
jgi:hypothetical protein